MEGKVMICRLLRKYRSLIIWPWWSLSVRHHRLGAAEELPKKFLLDKNAFMKPTGIDKVIITERE
jgi:hypothetical protein